MKEPHKISTLEQTIMLAVLYIPKNASAPNIRKCIADKCRWQVNTSTLYSSLDLLRKRDLLTCEVKPTRLITRAIKPMRFYHVTEKGVESLNRVKQITECMWEGAQKAGNNNLQIRKT